MSTFRFQDTVDGGQAVATAIINGRVHELLYIKNFEATMEKNKSDGKTLGKNSTQYKSAGWKGTGKIGAYYVTSIFRKLMLEYKNTNKDTFFTITVTNQDAATGTDNKQTIQLFECNLDKISLAKIDTDNPALDEELEFTFQDWNMTDEFSAGY